MVASTEYPEIANKINSTLNNQQQRGQAIKQHQTGITAKFVADKMKIAGNKMVGNTYTIERAHKTFLSKDGLLARNTHSINAFIGGSSSVLEAGLRQEASKTSYWTHQWRAALLEKVYIENLQEELGRAPSEGFILLHPKNPLGVGSHYQELAKWYDPVLKMSYDEVDWVTNADAFIPELKTSIEVKTKSSKSPSVQNKGLNTQNFSRYDGTIGYAILEVTDINEYPQLGFDDMRIKSISQNLAETLNFLGDKSNVKGNAKQWEKFIRGYDGLVYETRVNAFFSTFFTVEKASQYIKGLLQKLGLEAGKPLPQSYLESIPEPRLSPIILAVQYLQFAVMDEDFEGILRINRLREASSYFRQDAQSLVNQGKTTAEEIIDGILRKYLKDDVWVGLFKDIARNTGKAFASPSISMTQNYVESQAVDPSSIILGGSTRLT